MAHADFVHLRAHSAFSLSEGAIGVKELVRLCKEQRMPAIAVTDTSNLFGALQFAGAAADAGIQPIIGCQLHLSPPGDNGPQNGRGPVRRAEPDVLPVLVQDERGYANLLKILNQVYSEADGADGPQATLEMLEGRTDGLIALTGGCRGRVARQLIQDSRRQRRTRSRGFLACFQGASTSRSNGMGTVSKTRSRSA